MRKKTITQTLCAAAVSAALASCASSKQSVTLHDLQGEWDIIELHETAVVPAEGQPFPFIGFDATGRVYGYAGCNRITGAIDPQAKPGTIDLSRMGSTMMMCPDMTVERNVLAALGEVKRYRSLGNGQMALCGKSKKPIVVLQKRKSADKR